MTIKRRKKRKRQRQRERRKTFDHPIERRADERIWLDHQPFPDVLRSPITSKTWLSLDHIIHLSIYLHMHTNDREKKEELDKIASNDRQRT